MAQFASTLYPQTNPSNQILLTARDMRSAGAFDAFAAAFLSDPPHPTDGAEILHAKRVLTRLANLSG